MNITIFTGWIAAVLIVLNFATCWVLPWSKKKIEDGKPKICDGSGCKNSEHPLGEYHKPIVYLTIISIITHIVISLIN